jgi:hypothetical protein
MEDRAQVILIITGLGATPIEETLQGAEKLIPAQNLKPVLLEENRLSAAPLPQQVTDQNNTPQLEVSSSSTNLDIPAFMRRRYRFSG